LITARYALRGDHRRRSALTKPDVHPVPAKANAAKSVIGQLELRRHDGPATVVEPGRRPRRIVAGREQPLRPQHNPLAEVAPIHMTRILGANAGRLQKHGGDTHNQPGSADAVSAEHWPNYTDPGANPQHVFAPTRSEPCDRLKSEVNRTCNGLFKVIASFLRTSSPSDAAIITCYLKARPPSGCSSPALIPASSPT